MKSIKDILFCLYLFIIIFGCGAAVETIQPKVVIITFNHNYGTTPKVVKSRLNIEGKVSIVDPKRVGYDFAGWYTTATATSTTKVDLSTRVFTTDTTLYASWILSLSGNLVRFNHNYGVSTIVNEVLTNAEGKVSIADPSRTGYDFAGWYTTATAISTTKVDLSKRVFTTEITLYASWIINLSGTLISFNRNYGTPQTVDKARTNTEGKVSIADPSRTGYDFAGWYTTAISTNKVDLSTSVFRTSTTLYAKWEVNKSGILISFNHNYGTPQTVDKARTNTEGKVSIADPSRSGYDFAGWYSTVATTSTTKVELTTKVFSTATTLYAKWEVNKSGILISFNHNYGTPQTVDKARTNTEGKVSIADPSRSGYDFAGWYSTVATTSTTKVELTTKVFTTATTLYAKWEVNKSGILISFNHNYGTPQTVDKARTNTEGKVSIADPSRTGYDFAGWYSTVATTSTTKVELTTKVFTTATTLYAKWSSSNIKTVIAEIKSTKKIDVFNTNIKLYDRRKNKIKDTSSALPFSKVFPSSKTVIDLYSTSTSSPGYAFQYSLLLVPAGAGFGININKEGFPYFKIAIGNKIYLDDDHSIIWSIDRDKTYIKKVGGAIWETNSFYWNLERSTATSNTLSKYQGYKFLNYPEKTTNLDASMHVRFQTSRNYIVGKKYIFQLTIRQKLITPTGEIQLEDKVILKEFTTKGGTTGTTRYTNYPPEVFFDKSNTEFGYNLPNH